MELGLPVLLIAPCRPNQAGVGLLAPYMGAEPLLPRPRCRRRASTPYALPAWSPPPADEPCRDVISAAKADDPVWYAAVCLAGEAGLRVGEMKARSAGERTSI
jgi:hypothetical protein